MIVKVKYRLKQKVIDRILRLKDVVTPEPAETFVTHSRKDVESDAEIRRTEIRWLMPDRFRYVHEELASVVREHQLQLGINTPLFIEKGVQLATYGPGDHYSWHEDGHPGDATRRQLSISVLLTANFNGGALEFKRPGAPQLKRAGDIVLFHSWETHRVAAITSGVRNSLVVWFKTP